MKHIKKIIGIIIIVLFILWLSIFYIVRKNNNYEKRLINEIKENYQIQEEITDVNTYDNNYIVITPNKVIVLNSNYENIKEESTSKLAQNTNNYTLIYKNNNLMYENTILKEDKVIYEYYDAYTYEYVNNIILEE